MAIETSAAIHIRVDGQQQATRAAGEIEGAFDKASRGVSNAFRGVGKAVGDAVGGAITDVGRLITASAAINLSGARQQAIQLEEGYTRAGIAGRRSFQDVAGGVERTSKAILEQPDRVLAWGNAVGRLTYNYQGLEKAAEAAGKEGIADNQSLGDLQGFTVTLRNVLGVSGDTADALARVRGQAEKLGTVGGAAALRDQIEAASGALSQFASNTDQQRNKITALVGVLGQGLKPVQAQQVQQSVLGRISSDPIGIQRFLGRNILDKQGQIEDPAKVIQDVVTKVEKTYGPQARRVLQQNFGAVAGAQLDNLFKGGKFDEIGKVAQAGPSQQADTAQRQLVESAAGRRTANELEKQRKLRESVSGDSLIGKASDAIGKAAAKNPLLTGAGAAVGTRLLGIGVSKLAGTVFGGGAAAGAGAGTGATAGTAGAGAAGTVAAAGLGTLAAGAAGVLGAGAIIYGVTTDDPRKQYERFERRAARGGAASELKRSLRGGGATGASPDDVPSPLQVPGPQGAEASPLADIAQQIATLIDTLDKGGGITIVNQTGGPIQAVEGRRAGGSAGAQ
jgi:hypothetical protein